MPGVKPWERHEYLTDRLSTEAVEFIQRRKNGRLFCIHGITGCIRILVAKFVLIAKYRVAPVMVKEENDPILAAMLKSIDDGVEQIMRSLKALDLNENTLIVFSSNDDGEGCNAPLRTGKSTLYENGFGYWW
jgi:arylsulfatase A